MTEKKETKKLKEDIKLHGEKICDRIRKIISKCSTTADDFVLLDYWSQLLYILTLIVLDEKWANITIEMGAYLAELEKKQELDMDITDVQELLSLLSNREKLSTPKDVGYRLGIGLSFAKRALKEAGRLNAKDEGESSTIH